MNKLDHVYMQMAHDFSIISKALRKRVGAILVTQQGVILSGVNGTPHGCDNACETVLGDGTLVTKPEVLHAEINAILKSAKEGVSVVNSTIYLTLSPCLPCAAMLIQAGVYRVVYDEEYRCKDGIEYLKKYGMIVEQIERND